MTDIEMKDILCQQLQLLVEKSKDAKNLTVSELCHLTSTMTALVVQLVSIPQEDTVKVALEVGDKKLGETIITAQKALSQGANEKVTPVRKAEAAKINSENGKTRIFINGKEITGVKSYRVEKSEYFAPTELSLGLITGEVEIELK